MASFGNFPFRICEQAIGASDSEKPRINARFFWLVLLKQNGLLVLDRAFLRGLGRQLGWDRLLRAVSIYEQLKLDCIFPIYRLFREPSLNEA